MSDRRLREAAFFDAAVGPVKDAPVDRFISDLLSNIPADLSGARVLDLGCGIGELSRLLADRGARVTGVDVSSEALAQATSDTRCGFALAAAEQLPFPDSSFDLVVGSLILHHLPIERTAQELRRILRSEGRALFSENFGLNPVLRLARRYLTGRLGVPQLGTDDEKPLDRTDLSCLRQFFRLRMSHPDFLFFHLLDRQLFGYRRPAVNKLCIRLDGWIHRGFPALRPYSYRSTLILEQP